VQAFEENPHKFVFRHGLLEKGQLACSFHNEVDPQLQVRIVVAPYNSRRKG
jgi:hypothetical protein